jgi:hypothetical protein
MTTTANVTAGAILCVVRKIRCGSENADDPEEQESKREPNQDADQDSDFGLPPHLLLVRRELEDVPSEIGREKRLAGRSERLADIFLR